MSTEARYAKLAGWLYLLVFVLAPLSLVYVRSKLITPGDSGATADAVTGSEWLLRLGSVGELVVVLCDVVLAVAFYVLLRPVNQPLALLAAFLRLMHSAITGVNLVTNLIALHVLDSVEGANRDALALLFLESHDYFFATGLVFFGLHLLVLGYLMLRTVAFPRVLGVLLAVASVCYLANSFAALMALDYGGVGEALVLLPAAVAELALCGWLIVGRRSPAPVQTPA